MMRTVSALRGGFAAIAVFGLLGCAQSTTMQNGYDPLIGANRTFHAVNKGLDRAIIRPVSIGYREAVPATVKHVINNEVRFLSLPGTLVNSALQGDLERTGDTAARFLINGTLGGLGALDPATEMNIPEHDEDFGQTLAVWGAAAGPYIELPFFGPSSVRGVAGRLGDAVLDPIGYVGGGAGTALSAGRRVGNIVDTRYRFGDLIDEALYNSPDSYLTVRNLYLQRRKSAILNGQIDQQSLPDIYESEPF